jgi:hypothetical protein
MIEVILVALVAVGIALAMRLDVDPAGSRPAEVPKAVEAAGQSGVAD